MQYLKPIETIISYPIETKNWNHIIKKQLEYDENEVLDDEFIDQKLQAATFEVQNYIQEDICKTKKVLTIKDFIGDRIDINEGHFISVESVIIDISTNDYTVLPFYNSTVIKLNSSVTQEKDIIVTYYTGLETLPPDIFNAILIATKDLMLQKDSMIVGATRYEVAWKRLVNKYKRP